MKDYSQALFRTETYLSILSEKSENDLSMNQLSEMMGIPISQIRKDILFLYDKRLLLFDSESEEYENLDESYRKLIERSGKHGIKKIKKEHLKKVKKGELIPSKNGLKKDLNKIFEEENKNLSDKFSKIFNEGYFDDIPIDADILPVQDYFIPLTHDEMEALNAYRLEQEEHLRNVLELHYLIKSDYHVDRKARIFDNIDLINRAMLENKGVKIKYSVKPHEAGGETLLNLEMFPLKISYDNLDNKYAVLSVQNDRIKVNNIDRILKVELMDTANDHREEQLDLIEQKYKKVWGNSFGSSSFYVKVRFRNEANVWEKVRRDIFYREPLLLEEQNVDGEDYLYYEDIVYGIDKFKSWILSYGSSVEVIEPQNLKIRVIDSLKERAKYYGIKIKTKDGCNE